MKSGQGCQKVLDDCSDRQRNKLLFRDLKLQWSEGLSKTVKQHVQASDISVQTYFKATKTSDGKY